MTKKIRKVYRDSKKKKNDIKEEKMKIEDKSTASRILDIMSLKNYLDGFIIVVPIKSSNMQSEAQV